MLWQPPPSRRRCCSHTSPPLYLLSPTLVAQGGPKITWPRRWRREASTMLLPAPSEEGEASAERSRIALPPVGRRAEEEVPVGKYRRGKGRKRRERERAEMGALKHFGGRKIAPLCSSFFFLPPPFRCCCRVVVRLHSRPFFFFSPSLYFFRLLSSSSLAVVQQIE